MYCLPCWESIYCPKNFDTAFRTDSDDGFERQRFAQPIGLLAVAFLISTLRINLKVNNFLLIYARYQDRFSGTAQVRLIRASQRRRFIFAAIDFFLYVQSNRGSSANGTYKYNTPNIFFFFGGKNNYCSYATVSENLERKE